MSTLENISAKQFKNTLRALFIALVIFSFAYPALYLKLTFNRSWPMTRASLIRSELESLKKGASINIILGSCGGESSLRADLLTKLTGKNWYNFTLRGAQPSFQNKLLQKIKNQEIKIEHVLYVIEPTDLTVQQEQISKRFVTQDFEKRIFNFQDILKSEKNLSDKLDDIFTKAIYSDILPWVFTQALALEFSKEKLSDIKNYRAFTLEKSFEDFEPWSKQAKGTVNFNYPHSYGLIIKQQNFLLKEDFENYLKYSEQLEGRISLAPSKTLLNEFLLSIVAYSKNSEKVTVILPPELPALYNEDPERTNRVNNFAKFFNEKNIGIINAAQFSLVSPDAFLDFDHLSFEASAEFTKQIAQLTGEIQK